MTKCTRCDGTGFLNTHQLPDEVDVDAVLAWMEARVSKGERLGGCSCHINPPCDFCLLAHDVAVCDCCGDGEGWHGEPGHHTFRPFDCQ